MSVIYACFSTIYELFLPSCVNKSFPCVSNIRRAFILTQERIYMKRGKLVI